MVDPHWAYRSRQIMDPVCDTFQRWKAGELEHKAVDQAIDAAFKDECLTNNLLTHRPDRAATAIQWWDRV